MRHRANWIAAVLILLVVGLVGSVAAQKGKPAPDPTPTPTVPRWTVQVIGVAEPGVPTITGGTGATRGEEVLYDPGVSAAVQTGASYGATSGRNYFSLFVKNLEPTVDREIAGPQAISFENIAFEQNRASDALLMGLYSANANKIGPYWDGFQWRWHWDTPPVVQDGPPDYQASFLNSGPHPQLFYKHVLLNVHYLGSAFFDLLPEETQSIVPEVGIQVPSVNQCTAPTAAGIGITNRAPASTPAGNTITRNGPDQWTITVNQSIYMYEYGTEYVYRQVGKKLVADCQWKLHGGWWTTPVQFTMIVRRITS